jgi:microcystin-dependent protein
MIKYIKNLLKKWFGKKEAVQLTEAQMPSHYHTYQRYATQTGGNEGSGGLWYHVSSNISTGDTGGDGYHSNIPPAMILNFIIKT